MPASPDPRARSRGRVTKFGGVAQQRPVENADHAGAAGVFAGASAVIMRSHSSRPARLA